MARPIPRNPNDSNAHPRIEPERARPPRAWARFRFFINEAELPQGRAAQIANQLLCWAFFLTVEALIITFCFNILGYAFADAPKFLMTFLTQFRVALFLLLSYHAIFRINIFR